MATKTMPPSRGDDHMRNFAKVHQFHSGSALGDAVTNDMLEVQRVLQAAGFQSEIFVDHIASGLQSKLQTIATYAGDPSSLLIVHHSMGFDGFEKIVTLPDRKILRYHNITPPQFLAHPFLKSYAEKGRRQVREYVKYIELAVGDSEFNRQELASVGYRYTVSLPIFFRPESLLDEKPDLSLLQKLEGTFNLLFVGRLCPNKKQDDLVRIFASCYRLRKPDARLLLVGSWEGNEEYAKEIRSDIAARGLDQVVSLTGKISLRQLVACYRSSHILVCASEHEGFCVPLLEAMAFDLPVVAFRAAAVPETLGSAGVLLDEKDPESVKQMVKLLKGFSSLPIRTAVQSRRLRPDQARTLYGSIHKLTRDTGWKPKYKLEVTLRDLYVYWKEMLLAERR